MNTFFKSIVASFFISYASLSFAQQLPVMGHYIYNPYLYNPARTGQNKLGSVNMNFKKQWVNMPQSPLTGILSIEGPIPGESKNMGLGAMIYSDQMHIISKTGGMATYAYHINFEKSEKYFHRLSAGISVGFLNQRFNFAEANLLDGNDAQVVANAVNGTSFDFSGGLDYQYKGLHIGASMLQGLNNSMKFISPNDTNDIKFVNSRHFIFTGSYRHDFGNTKNNFYLEPVFLGRLVPGLPFQAEGNLVFGMRNIGWLGFGYRSSNTESATSALTFTAGIEINNRVMAAYSMDMGVDKSLNNSLGMQHEFMLACRIGKDDSKLIKEMELLKQEDLRLQEALLSKEQEMNKALNAQRKDAAKKEEELKGKINTLSDESEELKGKVLVSEKEIEELKKKLEEMKITQKQIGEVFFDINSSDLNTEAKTNLNTLKSLLDSYPKGIVVYLFGNASTDGDAKYNMELAVKRGAAVRNYLIEQGSNADKIYIIPLGEYNPMSGDPKRQENRDRRIDIMVSQNTNKF
jgi:type IX secretion system PorP/SprF family membrane protein